MYVAPWLITFKCCLTYCIGFPWSQEEVVPSLDQSSLRVDVLARFQTLQYHILVVEATESIRMNTYIICVKENFTVERGYQTRAWNLARG
jgi:hypothetical protein